MFQCSKSTSTMYPNNHSTETNRNQNRTTENPRMKANGIWGDFTSEESTEKGRSARRRRRRATVEAETNPVRDEADQPQPRPDGPPKEEEDEGGRRLRPRSPAGGAAAPWPSGSRPPEQRRRPKRKKPAPPHHHHTNTAGHSMRTQWGRRSWRREKKAVREEGGI